MSNYLNKMAEENILDRISKFVNRCDLMMPDVIDNDKIEKYANYNCIEAFFICKKQIMAEDLTQMFNEKMRCPILFAVQTKDRKRYRINGFSLPDEDGLYILDIHSDAYGIVENFTVTFYLSIDDIFNKIKELFLEFENKIKKDTNVIILESMTPAEVWKYFWR